MQVISYRFVIFFFMDTTTPPQTPPPMLTVGDLARRLQVDPLTIRRWIAAGKLRAVKLGKSYRIHPDAVDELIRDAKP
jgi:excisionase family DNA binding protein